MKLWTSLIKVNRDDIDDFAGRGDDGFVIDSLQDEMDLQSITTDWR